MDFRRHMAGKRRIETWAEIQPIYSVKPERGLNKEFYWFDIDAPENKTHKDWSLESSAALVHEISNGELRSLRLSGTQLPPETKDAWEIAYEIVDDFALCFSFFSRFPMRWRSDKVRVDAKAPMRWTRRTSHLLNDASRDALGLVAQGKRLPERLRSDLEIYRAALTVSRKERLLLHHVILERHAGPRVEDPLMSRALEAIKSSLAGFTNGLKGREKERVLSALGSLRTSSIGSGVQKLLVERKFAKDDQAARRLSRLRGALAHNPTDVQIDAEFEAAENILSGAVETLLEEDVKRALEA